MRKGQNRKVNNVGKASCLGLLTLGMALVNPVGCLSAFAEDTEEVGVPVVQSDLLISSVQIAFGEPVGVSSLTPIDANGASALYSVRATVDVSNSGGYTVYLGSSKAELTGKNSGATINGVTSSTNYEGMPVNSWGYSYAEGETAGTTFSAMPANVRGVTLGGNNSTNIKNDSKTFTLSFAAHIGNDKPADTYENEVTMSVVSSPLEITHAFGIETMQEMTSSICSGTTVGMSDQLKDTRDGKFYWVSKLADGKCWMTQNLDLDLSTGIKLTSDTSDVPAAGYTPGFTTATTVTSSTVNSSSQTEARSWSLGNYRIANPDISSDCGYPKNSAADCPAQFMAYTTPMSQNDDVNAHYILGNHYQWNAATAGTGNTITSGTATNSICPKGWRLPTSNGGQFTTLVDALGGTSSTNNATKAPFYGARGGYVSQGVDDLYAGAGVSGYYWSSSPNSNRSFAYSLFFADAANVNPSFNTNRNAGFSIRCVAR